MEPPRLGGGQMGDEEHWARTHRLIGRGELLEAVFPAVVEMEGEDAKAFLIALSRLLQFSNRAGDALGGTTSADTLVSGNLPKFFLQGMDAKAFLIALSRLPGARELAERTPKNEGEK